MDDLHDQPFENAFGMGSAEIAQELRKTYYRLLGRELKPNWKDMPSNLRARWCASVEVLFVKCERQVQTSAKAATQSFVDSIAGDGSFKKMPRSLQIIWEAILRHAINLVVAGMARDPGENANELRREFDQALKDTWEEWVAERLEKETKDGVSNAAN
jgi:hypothetical protein